MENKVWFYARGNQQLGPVVTEQLKQLLTTHQVLPTDLVWTEGMAQWQPAQSVPELAAVAPAYATPHPTLAYQGPAGPYAAQPYVEYAGFWLRFVAYILDSLITGIGGCIFGGCIGGIIGGVMGAQGVSPQQIQRSMEPLQVLFNLVGVVIAWLYFAFMESSSKQATLGKMALGLYVTDLNGHRLSFARATGRYFAKFLSAIILLIGFMMAGWTERKQALHDIVASTLVMRKR